MNAMTEPLLFKQTLEGAIRTLTRPLSGPAI